LGNFGANLYRGCEHGCVYCDGRAERYYVDGEFERDISVKINAFEIARKELKQRREPGFIFLGGGVSDSYQPAEAQYQIARRLLQLTLEAGLGVHVLTKSALVERDFDLLTEISRQSKVIVSFSLHTVDDKIRRDFEPKAASVNERLRLLECARKLKMHGGIMAMPILPGLSDQAAQIHALVRSAKDAGAEFVCFGGLTLRPGRQKEFYYEQLRRAFPHLVVGYDRAYGVAKASGAPDVRFGRKVTERFAEALDRFKLPARIPRYIFQGFVPLYTEASVLLEHAEFEAVLRGQSLPLMKSGHAIAKWAHARLVSLSRKGLSYQTVESEFVSRLKEGSLTDIPNVSQEAVIRLKALGFGS
jgi:DNA repair photolyase